MKTKTGQILLLALTAWLIVPSGLWSAEHADAAATPPAVATPAPLAVIAQPVHEFPPTPEGSVVTHDFVVQNHGQTVLNILRVKTS